MATINLDPSRYPNMLDYLQREHPDGVAVEIVRILTETNAIMDDIVFMEGNTNTGHKTQIQLSQPEPQFVSLTGGVKASKSTYGEINETAGHMESMSKSIVKMDEYNNRGIAWRMEQDRDHTEVMVQKMARTILYGDDAGPNPEDKLKFKGFDPRYRRILNSEVSGSSRYANDLSSEDLDHFMPNARNIIDATRNLKANGLPGEVLPQLDSSDSNTIIGQGKKFADIGAFNSDTEFQDIWLIVWGKTAGFYPKGLEGGLRAEAWEPTWENIANPDTGDDEELLIARTWFRWSMGLIVPDWRLVVRIANLHPSLIFEDPDKGINLPRLMKRAIRRLPDAAAGRIAWYMSRDMETALDEQLARSTENSTLTMEEFGGRPQTAMYQGFPIRRCDAILGNNLTRIT